MSITKSIPQQQFLTHQLNTPAEEEHDETSIEELWNIIENQRDIIQELQKALNEVTLERDYLLTKNQVSTPTKSLSCSSSSSTSASVKTTNEGSVISQQPATTNDSGNNKLPIPPPRSPYRSANTANTANTDTQLKINNIPLSSTAQLIKKSKLQQNNGLVTERESSLANLNQKDDRQPNLKPDQTTATDGLLPEDLTPIQLRVLPQQHDDFFILSIINQNSKKELYKIEKLYTDLLFLDMTLKESTNQHTNSLDFLFSETKTHDKIEAYLLNTIKDLQHDDQNMSLLYSFISKNEKDKEEYLTKRGKYHVKKHYFILSGLELVYFCVQKDGQVCMGNINLVPEKTRIGKQSNHHNKKQQQRQNEESTLFQHAFIMLLEEEHGGYKHILCAQSDQERDEWVKLLYNKCTPPTAATTTKNRNRSMTATSVRSPLKQYMIRSNSDTSLHPGEPFSNTINIPVNTASSRPIIRRKTYQRSSMDEQAIKRYQHEAAAATAAAATNNNLNHLSLKASADSLPSVLVDTPPIVAPKERKSFFWNRKKIFANNAIESAFAAIESETSATTVYNNPNTSSTTASSSSTTVNTTSNNFPTFGVPLDSITHKVQDLPTIAYRCIEYLQAQDAVHEEGIYRLSGSNVKINFLRNQFCKHGDIELLQQIDLDVHVVAGLFKMWLRELPVNVLTRKLLDEFISVIDVKDKQARVNRLAQLVARLPITNYTLLRALIAHLIRIVHHAEYNKMTLRNISIVFAPTLSIPSGVFTLLMKDFDFVFSGGGGNNKPASYSSTVYSTKSSSSYAAIHPFTTATSSSMQIYPEPSSSADKIKQLYLKKSEQEFGAKYNNESGYYA